MDNNLPDDCQGRGEHLPWNQEFTEECFGCRKILGEDDEAQEISTSTKGCQFVCMDCAPDYEEDFIL